MANTLEPERLGFVSDGITAMAVKSQMEIPTAKVEDFDELEKPIEWAQE
jgi:hypothetical protein